MRRTSRLLCALAIDLAIAAAEVVGGVVAHSTGLLATAGHDLADAAALGLAYAAARLVTRPPTPSRSFGLHRVTILTALANAVALVAVSILVGVLAVHRLVDPAGVRGGTVVVFAAVALAGNAAAALVLKDGSRDLNMRAALLHLVGDAVAALGVLGAGAVIYATGGSAWLDPAVSLAIAAFVVAEAIALVHESVDVLLESTPSDVAFSDLSAAMGSVAGVTDVHDLHCWSLSTDVRALSAHVVLDGHPSLEAAQLIGDDVKRRLREEFSIAHATLELECEPCAEPEVDPCVMEAHSAASVAPPSHEPVG